MSNKIQTFFQFENYQTNLKREIIAGLTTFLTMSYIIIVNPAILQAAGIPAGPSMVATVLAAVVGTLAVGLYANRPFAMAPYMGENAFIAFTVVQVLGYSWQTALGAVFLGGLFFVILTLLRVRPWLAEAIPQSLKYSFAVGIGLFLTFIGLNETGIVILGSPGAPVRIGQVTSVPVLLAIFGFFIMSYLMIKKIRGAILIGILVTTFLSLVLYFVFNLSDLFKPEVAAILKDPKQWISLQPLAHWAKGDEAILFKLNLRQALTWGLFGVVLTLFIMDFVDTMGTLIGVSARAGLLDEQGNLPEIEKPMLVDALATSIAALFGTTTTGVYLESAAGVEAGGRTGLTAVVVAILFLLSLFFAPFFTAIPPQAYGPALIVVGLLMLSSVSKINFEDYTESIPAFTVIILMSFTYNIGVGMTAGFILYPFFKLITGRHREIHPGLWVLCGLSLLFFIFYPYS